MLDTTRQLAVITGASTGIGLELARLAARKGYDLIIAANEDAIHAAADELRREGGQVEAVNVNLSGEEGVDVLMAKIASRPVSILMANAGRGLGKPFLDQDWEHARFVIETNVLGTLYLLQAVGRKMRAQGEGRILITGSIAGYIPGAYQAVYNASKAFLDSFSYALREELTNTRVTVTCLMPGPTETEFFRRADLMDTKVGAEEKADPAKVAEDGFEAMLKGEGGVVSGWSNKLQVAAAHLVPDELLARQHTKEAAPGTAKK